MIKNLFWSIADTFAPAGTAAPVILMYHSIGHNAAAFTVTPEDFEKQMAFLKSSGKECLKLSEFASRLRSGNLPSNAVAVTFDDGYEDNHETALPILKRYSIPATAFVVTGFISKELTVNNRFEGQPGGPIALLIMDEAQIKNLSNSGLVEFMPHGHSHTILRDMDREAVIADVEESKKAIESLTGKPATSFAYPYGKYSDETIEIIAEQGFQSAVTVREGVVDINSNAFELPRMNMSASTSLAEFRCKVAKPRLYLKLKHAFHRTR